MISYLTCKVESKDKCLCGFDVEGPPGGVW